jgi:hypothetical protein
MSAVNESVAREYFESLGFLVSQPRKYSIPGRAKTAEEEMDLLVFNPLATTHVVSPDLVWSTEAIKGIQRAVVGVRGWHTERFYVSTFEQTPDILRFAERKSTDAAARLLNSDSFAKILCLPRLPASGELKDRTIAALREKGIDGVVSFGAMLAELAAYVECHKNYDKSDLLQTLRLLKNYGLLKEPQMEFFAKHRSHSARGKARGAEASGIKATTPEGAVTLDE